MGKVLKFQAFLNERYEESPDYRIKSFFEELEKNIKDWFENGTFAANKAILGQIKRSLADAIDKNLIFEFNDEEFYYQVIIVVSLQEVEEDLLDECYIKIKKYDLGDMTLLRTIADDVKVSDLNEDKILEIINKLDDESASIENRSGEVSVSDDDTDLEDDSIV